MVWKAFEAAKDAARPWLLKHVKALRLYVDSGGTYVPSGPIMRGFVASLWGLV